MQIIIGYDRWLSHWGKRLDLNEGNNYRIFFIIIKGAPNLSRTFKNKLP